MNLTQRARILFSPVIALLCISSLSALEIKEGRIKLVLNEDAGRFTAYYLNDVRTNKYTALFLDQDPRTTVLSVIIGNKVYRMGESAGFSQSVEKTVSGARYTWKSNMIEAGEDFSFIKSKNSPLADGIKIAITIKNISEQDLSIGIRYLIDTYLGEKSNLHFRTDSISRITNETSFSGRSMPKYLVSYSEDSGIPGLQIMTQVEGISIPDNVIIANWKRLNDNTWSYEVNTTRNFNQLPYSINDSAACLYYNPVQLARNKAMTITLVMGSFVEEGFNITEAAKPSTGISEIFDKTIIQPSPTGSGGNEIDISVQTDLISVTDLISKINAKLSSGE
ncbi:MAG: hypothetical protein AB1798_12880, partial [Spirochaetota bacterium]